ncbi:MAG: hypothetical protein U0T36_08590 [Saprospiraceae bacterium]
MLKRLEFLKNKTSNVEFWIVGELDAKNPATINKDDLIKWWMKILFAIMDL